MRRLLLVETRKIVDTRSGRWLLVILALACLLGSVALALSADSTAGPTAQTYVGLIGSILATLLPILGVLTATAEWSQRTGLVTFALEPRRGRVIAAKLISTCIVALLILLVGLAMSAAVAVTVAGLRQLPLDWLVPWASILGLVVLVVIHVLQGLAFGFALLNTPLAIVALFFVPLITGVASFMGSLAGMAAWLDLGAAAGLLTQGFGALGAQEWAQLGVAGAIWVGVPLAIGCWRIQTQEIR